jgi:hypothetical protein
MNLKIYNFLFITKKRLKAPFGQMSNYEYSKKRRSIESIVQDFRGGELWAFLARSVA